MTGAFNLRYVMGNAEIDGELEGWAAQPIVLMFNLCLTYALEIKYTCIYIYLAFKE